MTRLQASITTPLPIDQAFDFVADFANSSLWDPGVATSSRIGSFDAAAPAATLGVGSSFQLGVRMRGQVAPMEYRITNFERPGRVTLAGSGSSVTAVDDIQFSPTATGGTQVDYTADIHLGGWMRLVEPFASGAFRKLAANALNGMQRALNERAVAAGATAAAGGTSE